MKLILVTGQVVPLMKSEICRNFNCSILLEAAPGYREAKLHTLLDTVPDVLGPGSKPSGLSWQGANGHASA